MSQVTKKGEKPASSPKLDEEAARREALRRGKIADRAPTEGIARPSRCCPERSLTSTKVRPS